MRFQILAVSVVLSLAGCGTSTVRQAIAPDGKMAATVKCKSDSLSCLEAASESCNGGSFQVLSSNSHSGGLVADIMPGPVTWYQMTYRCGPTDGKVPAFAFQGGTMADVMSAMPKTPPRPAPVTTNCYKAGTGLSCTSQ